MASETLPAETPQEPSVPINVTDDGKITKVILRPGWGVKPRRGQKVNVHYVGRLTDGTEFDTSRTQAKPFNCQGGVRIIAGGSLVLVTMKTGELARVSIAPEYAYGAQGYAPAIPPDATLIFEIELLKVTK
jgi:FKBP-type peptidyl-prolyl cis-trans isomerase